MKAPFRADQVGSLLRPAALAKARAQFKRGELSQAELKKLEDEATAKAVAKQESIGLQSITDGELRRDWWHLDFLSQLDGVSMMENPGPKFGAEGEQPPVATVTGKVGYTKPIHIDHFTYLKSVTQRTPKFTIPSPSMLHLRGGRKAISTQAYPDLEEFWADVAVAYQKAIAAFHKAGCNYLQLDDVAFAYLGDDKFRESAKANGDDPTKLPRRYAQTINEALKNKPAGMTITMHTCHGNFRSSSATQGGYDDVAEAMFSTNIDGYFMEFDTAKSGTFEPLRYLQKDKRVVLGVITTKVGDIESKDEVKRRIDAATKHVSLDNLCLSPQCGFASTHHGNDISEDDQWRKLSLVVEVANEVWGSK